VETEYKCPGCSGRLAACALNGIRQYVCERCAGHVLTIVGLRHLSPDAALTLWAHEDGQDGDGQDGDGQDGDGRADMAGPGVPGPARCPFCQREMQARVFGKGRSGICRPCEAVWLDKQAAQAVKVPEPATSSLSQGTRRCQHCGAVAEDTPDGNCRYCASPLALPTKVVVLEAPSAPERQWGRGASVLGGIAGGIIDTFLGWP
jgi:Zn-finger nucleic acid-binding protein